MKQTQHTTKQKNQNKFNKEEKKIIFFFSQIEKNCYLISYSNIMNKYIKIQNPFLFFLYLFSSGRTFIFRIYLFTKGNKKKDTKEEGVSNVKERIIKNVYIYSDT